MRIENSATVTPRQSAHRLAWCPFVPDNVNSNTEESGFDVSLDEHSSGGSDDHTRLLAVFHGSTVEVLNVDKIAKDFGIDTTFTAIESAVSSLDIDSVSPKSLMAYVLS